MARSDDLKIDLELLPMEKQPKNSWRYGHRGGDSGVESIYIRRNALKDPPPKRIKLVILEDDR